MIEPLGSPGSRPGFTPYHRRMNAIAEQRQTVLNRIRAACVAHGRDPQTVRLLAVSKTFGAHDVHTAWQGGQRAFGEN